MVPRASLPKLVIRAAVCQATKETTVTKVGALRCKSFVTIKTSYTMKRTEMQLILDDSCIFFDLNEEEELQWHRIG